MRKRTREAKRSLKKKSKSDDGESDKKGDIVMPLFEALVFFGGKKINSFFNKLISCKVKSQITF
jgi:hypothetical protein